MLYLVSLILKAQVVVLQEMFFLGSGHFMESRQRS